MINKSGIYAIINRSKNNKIYVGLASSSFKGRWADHKKALRNNYHPNKHLQNEWNIYKEESFDFIIIKTIKDIRREISKEQAFDFINKNINVFKDIKEILYIDIKSKDKYYLCHLLETYYISKYNATNREFGYNILPIGNSSLGYSSAITPEEVKRVELCLEKGVKQIDIANKFNISKMTVSNINRGKHVYSSKPNKIIRHYNGRRKISLELVLDIKKHLLDGDTITNISNKLNVSHSLIRKIRDGKHKLSKEIGGSIENWRGGN